MSLSIDATSDPSATLMSDRVEDCLEEVDAASWATIEASLENAEEPMLKEALLSRGYSPILRGIDFSDLDYNINLSGCQLIDCKFSGLDFAYQSWDHLQFINCDFQRSMFAISQFNQVSFINCNCRSASFYRSSCHDLQFFNCDLSYVCFEGGPFCNLQIDRSTPPPHPTRLWESAHQLVGTTFVGADIQGNSSISRSSLTDTIFDPTQPQFHLSDCTPHLITRPVIAWGRDTLELAEHAAMLHPLLIAKGQIPLSYPNHPAIEDYDQINNALEQRLSQYPGKEICQLSRAQWLLTSADPTDPIGQIVTVANQYIQAADGLILPGDYDDVPRHFYQDLSSGGSEKSTAHNKHLKASSQANVQEEVDIAIRSVTEFALLQQAEIEQMPVLGICKGAQVINVFLGGTLKQLSDGHMGTTPLNKRITPTQAELQLIGDLTPTAAQFVRTLLTQADTLYAKSAHSESIDRPGSGVVRLLDWQDAIKLALAQKGLWILAQVHPEILLTAEWLCQIESACLSARPLLLSPPIGAEADARQLQAFLQGASEAKAALPLSQSIFDLFFHHIALRIALKHLHIQQQIA